MESSVSDVWANVSNLDPTAQDRLAGVLETRGADPRQQAMRQEFLADLPFPTNALVLDVGCGTGVLTRVLARRPGISAVVGVDPAPSLLARARELAVDLPNLTFEQADGRSLPFAEHEFDVVIFDSTLSHVTSPERALTEAFRVLRPEGVLGVFDGDYATMTVALTDHDPLQACADFMLANSVTDRRVMRRLPSLIRQCGFDLIGARSHGYVETGEGSYMLTIIDRGADMLAARGLISDATATAFKAEARRRGVEGTFFGHIAYMSTIGRKPA
jgi:ubiquinone/menaquinone biosynthesis C-methylase UbiE